MVDKLVYGVCTENLIEIALAYASLVAKYPVLTNMDSITWKQKFVDWANEFEEKYPEPEHWEDSDYLECIDNFAREKIFEFAGIEQKPFYFTFGSWEKYPYQNTYLVVYAMNVRDAVDKFRVHHPDINENIVNCASWYSQESVDRIISEGRPWYNGEPAEIIR